MWRKAVSLRTTLRKLTALRHKESVFVMVSEASVAGSSDEAERVVARQRVLRSHGIQTQTRRKQ